MPKEQGCVGEHAPRTTSKNAKDKSNSAALLAFRATRGHAEQQASGRSSCCSSEKDSGYSDTGSDSLQTDAEDQGSSVSEQQGREGHKRPGLSEPGPLLGNHILVSGASELTPIFIIKNVMLKQPGQLGQDHLLQTPLSCGGGASSAQGPTHVLLLQQPGITSPPDPLNVLKPQPKRPEGGGKKSKATYLPILNSYPRIAPHPKKPPENPPAGSTSGSSGATEDHSLSKRVCTEEKREEVSTTTQGLKQHIHKQPESRAHPHPHPSSHSLSGSCDPPLHARRSPCPPSSPSTSPVSSSETLYAPSPCDPPAPLPLVSRGLCRCGSDSARHWRFLNTVDILSQSGLLDITLRTQELLRQSAATEHDIAQLRQHTRLLCQAAQAGAHAPARWDRVHRAMANSDRYPSLKWLGVEGVEGLSPMQSEVEADTSSKAYGVVPAAHRHHRGDEVAPPSPLHDPMPDLPLDCLLSEQHGSAVMNAPFSEPGRGHRAKPLEELLMPPDSSTNGSLL